MEVERTNSEALVVNKLPDGSRLIVDPTNEKVFALNATAGAAWDACINPTTVSKVADAMQRSFDPKITEDLAEEAILRLQEQNLVKASGIRPNRRQFMATLSAAALPLVVSLTMADQRAYANSARSGAQQPGPIITPLHPNASPLHPDPHPVHPTPPPVRWGRNGFKP